MAEQFCKISLLSFTEQSQELPEQSEAEVVGEGADEKGQQVGRQDMQWKSSLTDTPVPGIMKALSS